MLESVFFRLDFHSVRFTDLNKKVGLNKKKKKKENKNEKKNNIFALNE